jgi:hypothetical protein
MTQTERSTGRTNDVSLSADCEADRVGSGLNHAGRLAEQMQTALSRRALIDEAIGILIGRAGGSAEEAIAALREVSQAHDTDLATVSRQIVEEVLRQAQTRHLQRGRPKLTWPRG